MVVEVRVDHMNLMAEQHRASCLKLMAEGRMAEHLKLMAEEHREDCLVLMVEECMAELMKLMAEENMAEHLMLMAEKSKEEHMKLLMAEEHWAEHMKSKVDFRFLTAVLHLCFPSSLAQPYFSSQEANCA